MSVQADILSNTRSTITALTPVTLQRVRYTSRTGQFSPDLLDDIQASDRTTRQVWAHWGDDLEDMSPYTAGDAKIRARQLIVTLLYHAPTGRHAQQAAIEAQTIATEDADQIINALQTLGNYCAGIHLRRFVDRTSTEADGKHIQSLTFRVTYVYS